MPQGIVRLCTSGCPSQLLGLLALIQGKVGPKSWTVSICSTLGSRKPLPRPLEQHTVPEHTDSDPFLLPSPFHTTQRHPALDSNCTYLLAKPLSLPSFFFFLPNRLQNNCGLLSLFSPHMTSVSPDHSHRLSTHGRPDIQCLSAAYLPESFYRSAASVTHGGSC